MSGGIFWVGGGGWTCFMGEWKWLKVYLDIFYGWMGVSGGIFWVSGSGWE